MSAATAHEHAEAHGGHDHHEHHDPFWKKYIFSTDHKVIGLQYGFTSLVFLAFGFFLMMVMRWSIAYPDRAVPLLADWPWFQAWLDDGGKVTGDLYNMFGAMHGTIMVFLGIVPLAFGTFGNYVTPLQIGAPAIGRPASPPAPVPNAGDRSAAQNAHSARRRWVARRRVPPVPEPIGAPAPSRRTPPPPS